jgi:hypothetical protein
MDFPAELKGQTPRGVRMTWLGWANIFIATFFFVAGVALGVNFVQQILSDTTVQNALRRDGSDSTGHVTSKWRRVGGKIARDYVDYTFAVNGMSYSGESAVPRATWNSLRPDDSIPIRYLPENPNFNRHAGWEGLTSSDLWILVFPLAAAVFGLFFVRKVPLQRRLAMRGIGVRGCITDWHGPKRSGYVLDYTFKNATNGEAENASCLSNHSRGVSSEVSVLYLPSNPKRSEIYPFNVDFFRIE